MKMLSILATRVWAGNPRHATSNLGFLLKIIVATFFTVSAEAF